MKMFHKLNSPLCIGDSKVFISFPNELKQNIGLNMKTISGPSKLPLTVYQLIVLRVSCEFSLPFLLFSLHVVRTALTPRIDHYS